MTAAAPLRGKARGSVNIDEVQGEVAERNDSRVVLDNAFEEQQGYVFLHRTELCLDAEIAAAVRDGLSLFQTTDTQLHRSRRTVASSGGVSKDVTDLQRSVSAKKNAPRDFES